MLCYNYTMREFFVNLKNSGSKFQQTNFSDVKYQS